MNAPPRSSTAVDRKTCTHVVEGWWGNERVELCTPPWSVLRQALLVEQVDVAYVVVVGASSGAKRKGMRSPELQDECANTTPINKLVESFETAKDEPIGDPSPPPKYKLIIDDDEDETASQRTAECETNPIGNESYESTPLLEHDQEEHQMVSMDMENCPPTCEMTPDSETIAPVEVPPTNEGSPRPRFRLIID